MKPLRLISVTYFGLIAILYLISIQMVLAVPTTVNVEIVGVGKGRTFYIDGRGWYWAAEILIKIETQPGVWENARAYCMQYDVDLHRTTYQYDLIDIPNPDEPAWRAVSYLLTWYDPPADNDIAAAIQGAIWKIDPLNRMDPKDDPSGYSNYDPPGPPVMSIYQEAMTYDVIRQGDKIEWVTPDTIYAGPGKDVILTAKVTDSAGNPRPNVRVVFRTTGGTLNKQYDFTDADGKVTVILTTPSEMGLIEVEASTRRVWPVVYMRNDRTQDLIGLGDELGLTTTKEIAVIAQIHVIPEVPFGTLAAVATCLFAYIVKSKLQA